MSEAENKMDTTVPRAFLEELGFELPDEVFSFSIENNEIVFNLQIIDEYGCNFRFYETQEKFPLTEEQTQKLKDAGYYSADGFLIL